MSYGYDTMIGLVDKQKHRITHVSLNNNNSIKKYYQLTPEEQGIKEYESTTMLNIYKINKTLKLNNSVRLSKDYKNIRYTTPRETNDLIKSLKETLQDDSLTVIINNNAHQLKLNEIQVDEGVLRDGTRQTTLI